MGPKQLMDMSLIICLPCIVCHFEPVQVIFAFFFQYLCFMQNMLKTRLSSGAYQYYIVCYFERVCLYFFFFLHLKAIILRNQYKA